MEVEIEEVKVLNKRKVIIAVLIGIVAFSTIIGSIYMVTKANATNENKNMQNIDVKQPTEIAEEKVEQEVPIATQVPQQLQPEPPATVEAPPKENSQQEVKPEEPQPQEAPRPKTAATVGKPGTIYLTFDDGPSSNITPLILDVLKEEDVKATFFIINYDSVGEELIKREIAEGHSIGLHGYSHTYSEIYQNEDTYMNNLNVLQEKLKDSTGIVSKITRFPGGSSNTVSKKYNEGIMYRLINLVQERGYKYYDWNVDSNDAGSAKNKDQVYNNVVTHLKPNRVNIVLMHDFGKSSKTLEALRDIIRFGKENGYTFETITYESDMTIHHNVNN